MIQLKNFSLLSLLLCLILPTWGHASSIFFAPIPVEFAGTEQATMLTLINQTDKPANFQIRVFKWSQENGTDKLTPTNELVVSPPVFKMPGNQSYNVRVVRPHPTGAGPVEETYRLFVDELPQPHDARKYGVEIGMIIRSSIPVFIVPPGAMADVHGKIITQDGKTYVEVTNRGNRHVLLSSLALQEGRTNKTVKVPFTSTVNGYVLAHATRRYEIPKDALSKVDMKQPTIQATMGKQTMTLN